MTPTYVELKCKTRERPSMKFTSKQQQQKKTKGRHIVRRMPKKVVYDMNFCNKWACFSRFFTSTMGLSTCKILSSWKLNSTLRQPPSPCQISFEFASDSSCKSASNPSMTSLKWTCTTRSSGSLRERGSSSKRPCFKSTIQTAHRPN